MSRPVTPGVYVGQVIQQLTDKAVSVWILDISGSMIAWVKDSDDFPLGTVVFCRVDQKGEWINKLRPAGAETRIAYLKKLLM